MIDPQMTDPIVILCCNDCPFRRLRREYWCKYYTKEIGCDVMKEKPSFCEVNHIVVWIIPEEKK